MIYLAIPYSHPNASVRENRFKLANKIAAKLFAQGEHCFSPISQSHPIEVEGNLPRDWYFWEAYDRKILSICDKLIVVMADGWDCSTGVQAEIKIAKEELGIEVEYLDPYKFLLEPTI